MGKNNPQTAPFLRRLPLEIRIEVYRYLLSTRYTKKKSIARQCPTHEKLWPSYFYDLEPTILRASCQVYSEASTVLYDENLLVRVRSTFEKIVHLMITRGIPILLEGQEAENFKRSAMSVDFHHLDTVLEAKSQGIWSSYVIASNDLRLLCQGLLIEHTFDDIFKVYEFRVNIHHVSQNLLQRRLLEPFTVLHSATHFQIAGTVNKGYSDSIAARVSSLGPTLEDYLNQVAEITQKGHEHFRHYEFKRAMQAYKMAYSLLIETCFRLETMEINCIGFYFETDHDVLEYYVLLVRSRAFVHYKLDELEDARIWARDAIELGKRGISMECQSSYARLVYIKAIASARLGDRESALREMCDEMRIVCRDVVKDTRLDDLRRAAISLLKGQGGVEIMKQWPIIQ